jgi:hypothetical protein
MTASSVHMWSYLMSADQREPIDIAIPGATGSWRLCGLSLARVVGCILDVYMMHRRDLLILSRWLILVSTLGDP